MADRSACVSCHSLLEHASRRDCRGISRFRQPERRVLDTLVDAGVARSRSDALAWSVRLVGEHADEWLGQLRDAMAELDKLRGESPGL